MCNVHVFSIPRTHFEHSAAKLVLAGGDGRHILEEMHRGWMLEDSYGRENTDRGMLWRGWSTSLRRNARVMDAKSYRATV